MRCRPFREDAGFDVIASSSEPYGAIIESGFDLHAKAIELARLKAE